MPLMAVLMLKLLRQSVCCLAFPKLYAIGLGFTMGHSMACIPANIEFLLPLVHMHVHSLAELHAAS